MNRKIILRQSTRLVTRTYAYFGWCTMFYVLCVRHRHNLTTALAIYTWTHLHHGSKASRCRWQQHSDKLLYQLLALLMLTFKSTVRTLLLIICIHLQHYTVYRYLVRQCNNCLQWSMSESRSCPLAVWEPISTVSQRPARTGCLRLVACGAKTDDFNPGNNLLLLVFVC